MTEQFQFDRRTGADRRATEPAASRRDRRSGVDRRRDTLQSIPDREIGGMGGHRLATNGPHLRRASDWAMEHGGDAPPPRMAANRDAAMNGQLAELIAGFYDASMDNRQWPEVLRRLCALFHGDAAALAVHDTQTGYGHLEHAVNIDAVYLTAYADVYSRYNVWLQNNPSLERERAVFTGQQVVADRTLLEHDFYRYWLYPQGLFHHLFGVLDGDGHKVTYLLLARAPAKGAFWERETRLLHELLPSFARALRSGRSYRRTLDMQRILVESLDAMPLGVLVLSARGKILTANRFARELVDDEDAFHIGKTGLGLKMPQGKFRFRDLLDTTGAGRPVLATANDVQTFTVSRGEGRRPLSILLAPVKEIGPPRGPDDPAGLMFIGDPERPVEIDPRRLIRIFGLSRAEARVAVLLARGMRLDQVAVTLSLTYETVRKHVKQILSKTGADRQAELVRTITLGPSGLRL